MSKKLLRIFIYAILNESLGFWFGEPWRYSESSTTCVLPIIRWTRKKREYLTLAETSKAKIQDTGWINKVSVFNFEEMPVFIRMAELLEGDTQNRALVMSRVVMGNLKTKVKVACVHASQSIRKGSIFRSSGYSPGRDLFYSQALHSMGKVSQRKSWMLDHDYHSRVMTSLGGLRNDFIRPPRLFEPSIGCGLRNPDNLAQTRDEYNEAVAEIIDRVPLVEDQIGMVLIDANGFYCLECFNLHESWKAVHKDIIRKESLFITEGVKIEQGEVFEYEPETAKDITKEVLRKEYTLKTQHREKRTQTVTLDFGDYIGEAVSLDGEIIHLLITRKKQINSPFLP